ncbi:D-sedoheptulose-7-phosphate isomerase [Aeromicrobium wangtongii]|uniref:SIS domain-containing protein n=1 Tax=Aeromicrobium wangtongii TaxID=2969247 RepID=A0ABY5MBJ1_9ACTN|nr:SIS domain-containing protein [Aeromicrobium wangtongii]MCD9197625.1 SIS domain-containing protein [Aeromicrobium wangtongii]UUP15495.1 SIS domain-containing protein [Aeromicrobium wangtongii]
MRSGVVQSIQEWAELTPRLVDESLVNAVAAAGEAIVTSLAGGGRVLFAGNGGSASIASHLAAELVGRCVLDRQALAGLALADSASTLTALGNDHGYDTIFERGVSAFGRPGDVLVAMSTSGSSPNIVRAVARARETGLVSIAMTGERGDAFAASADHGLMVPSGSTQRVQEVHLMWGHAWCEQVDVRWHESERQHALTS